MHPRVPAPVVKPNHSFLTNFQLLLSISSCFYSFPLTLSILPISDCLYLFLTVFTQIWVFPLILTFFYYHFWIFSTIFDHFSSIFHHPHSYFITFNHRDSFSTTFIHFQLLWPILFGFQVIFTNFELVFDCYCLYPAINTYFLFLQCNFYLFITVLMTILLFS